ncbi:MAG TPA: protein kinase [Candidatus Acidoferrum sp.]|jgi:predicted Ser/Thr protein kinase|nr:protein kinase [Candidatus Acidoferrum sp.]
METERICPNCRKPLSPDVPMGLCPECLIKSGFPTGTEPDAGSVGRFVPPPVEEIAKLFPQFEILNFIGKGGMGAVYKARQPGLDRFVALKVLPPAVANDPGFAERFNREARALARLSHPNIVVVYDFGKAGELHYLVMEFVDGANLREIERAGRLSPEQALAIVPQICEALQFAHNEGIVHRDIKPENLLLDKKGRVKITDFGIAKIMGVTEGKVSLTGAKDVMGTPHYMAPEQIEKPQTVDHRADIYSLGVVFYEMLTGELPLGKFAPPSKKAPMDARLDEVVMHTLEKEPGQRYQQASQVKTDVETIATGTPPPISGAAKMAGAVPPTSPTPLQPVVSDRVILPAFLLAFFFGAFGAHCFYVGKIRTALLKLAGLGGCVVMAMVCGSSWGDNLEPAPGILFAALIFGCGAWAVIDWIMILCKVFTDGNGRRLVNWWHPNPNALQPPAPPVPPKAGSTPWGGGGGANAMIIAPAVALIIAGCLKSFAALAGLLFLLSFGAKHDHPLFFIPGLTHFLPAPIGAIALLFSVIPVAAMIYGGVEMLRLRSYAWAVAAAIVAIIFCSLVGTPVGVWALIVLLMAGVRETFTNRPAPPGSIKGFWILGALAAACLFLFLTICFFVLLVHAHHGTTASSSFASSITRAMQEPAPPSLPADDQFKAAEHALALQQMAEYPDMASIYKQSEAPMEQINQADAALARIKDQYANGLATSMEVQLAEDKKKLLNAQRLLMLQTPAYERGHVTSDAYEQDLSDVINDQAKVAADGAAITNEAGAAANPNSTAVTGTVPLSYQWLTPSNSTTAVSTAPDNNEAAVSVAEAWLTVVDNGNYDESWKESAPAFQNAVSEAKWEDSMNTFRKPLGNLLSRGLISAQPATQLPGAPEGEYVVIQFKTSFENNTSAVETVTVGPKLGDDWKVSGYYIK